MELAAAPLQRPRVPPGYHFTPTPRELIRCYLNPWVTAGLPAESMAIVCVADVYGADPDTLTSRLQHLGHDGNWYFLCVTRWKGGKAGTRMNRCVQGGGTWHGSSKRKPVGRDGYRQGFEYRDADDNKTVWIMEEFGTNLEEATGGEGVKVICKVHLTPRAATAEEERQETNKVGSKRLKLHEENGLTVVSEAPSPVGIERFYSSSSQAMPVSTPAAEEERRDTNTVGFKRPKLHEENGLAAAAAAQAPDDVECCYAIKCQAAPASAAAEDERRETDESWSMRPQLHEEHGPGAGWVAPSPVEAGCYHAGTSQATPVVNAAASTTWQQLVTEQGTECYCADDVHGGVDNQGQPEPLAVGSADMECHQFAAMDYGFEITAEDNDWLVRTFLCLGSNDGIEDDDDHRGDMAETG